MHAFLSRDTRRRWGWGTWEVLLGGWRGVERVHSGRPNLRRPQDHPSIRLLPGAGVLRAQRSHL